jgi:tape measure domain-containing protein
MAGMSLDTAIRLSAEVKGANNITKVQRSLQDLAKGSQTTARDMQTLRAATFQYSRANDGTIAGIRNSITAFRGLQEQAKIGSREFQRYGSEIQRLEGRLRGLDGTASQTNARFTGMAAAAGRLIAAYAGIEAVRFVFGNAAELESQTRSLEVLTGSADRAKQIVEELQQLGAVTPFTSTELIDTAKRLQAFGVETEQVVNITKRLADVSGATGAELAGLATAYGQVQAKGRLQGEELLQFQERGVALQEVLRKEYGLTGTEFQKALEKGQISAEAVEYALKKLTDTGGKYANGAIAQSDTLNGRLSTLADSTQVLAQTIGKTLEPVFKWALSQATAVVGEIQRMIDEANNAGGAKDREAQFANNANAAVRAMGLNPFTQQGMMADMRQRNIEQQRADYDLSRQKARAANNAPASITRPPLSGNTTPYRVGDTVGGGGGGGGGGAKKQSESMGAQIAKSLQKALDLTPAQSAGVVGNLMRESGLNPRVNEGGAVGSPRGVGGYGLAQWTGTRQKDLVRFAGGSAAAGDLQTQLRFMVSELMGPESRALASLRKTTTPEEAAVVFDRDYERSGIKALPERKANARRVYGEIAGSGPGAGLGDFADQLKLQADAAEKLREQKQAADELLNTERDRFAILQEADPMQKKIIESMNQGLEIEKKFQDLINASPEQKKTLELAQQYAIKSNTLELERELSGLAADAVKPLRDALTEAGNRLAYEREYGELLSKGINPELAKQFVELDRIATAAKTNLELQIAMLKAKLAELPIGDANIKNLERQIELRKEQLKLIPGTVAETKGIMTETSTASKGTPTKNITARIGVLKDEIKDLTDIGQVAITSADNIGNAFGSAFSGLISGAMSAREALAGFFKDIAAGFIEMAAQIIAKQMTMIVLQSILKALGAVAGASRGGGFGAGGAGFGGSNSFGSFDAGGALAFGGGLSFAGGGYTGNAPRAGGVDGQGGFPAILHPRETVIDHTRSMVVPYQRSATATATAPAMEVPYQRSGPTMAVPFQKAAGGAAGGGMAMAVDNEPIRFESIVINSVEYVSRAEAEEIGRRSEQRTFKKLKNSPSARHAAGIS